MTALAGAVVKRTFSVLARQFAGLPGLKTHEAGGKDFANLDQPFFRIISEESRDHHFGMMISDIQYRQRKCPIMGRLRLQNKWIEELRIIAKC